MKTFISSLCDWNYNIFFKDMQPNDILLSMCPICIYIWTKGTAAGNQCCLYVWCTVALSECVCVLFCKCMYLYDHYVVSISSFHIHAGHALSMEYVVVLQQEIRGSRRYTAALDVRSCVISFFWSFWESKLAIFASGGPSQYFMDVQCIFWHWNAVN